MMMRSNVVALMAVAMVVPMGLVGCGGLGSSAKSGTTPVSGVSVALSGKIIGGQNPISGANVQLYQAGTTNYGTGATPLIAGGVTTGTDGSFTLTGKYTCAAGSQVYITATGGNTGSGTNNASLIMAALGLCDNVPNIPFILVNEVTTVGAVWALAPFMLDTNGVIGIGAPSNAQAQTGMAAAFADVNTLVDFSTGSAPGPAAPSNAAVPSQEIYALANMLASCVNSSGSGGACGTMFGYATVGSAVPTDVVGAAINISRNPSVHASDLLQLGSSFPPFASTFNTATVNDLTLAVTYSGGGLNAPTGVALDASGNVWVANSGNNSVTKMSNAGVLLSGANGYTAGAMNVPSAIAIDTSGNAWITNSGNATLTELSSTGVAASGTPFSGGGLSSPSSISFDGLGNAWVANYGNSSVSEFSSTGTALSPTGGYTATGLVSPIGVAVNPH